MSVTATELKIVPCRSVISLRATNASPAQPAPAPSHLHQSASRREPCTIDHGGYRVCAAHTAAQHAQAADLVARMYSTRGYETHTAKACMADPCRITLTACRDGNVFGTLTLGLDSDHGMLADTLYGKELDAFRRRGCKPCELSRFAIDPNFSSKEILASIFNLAYLYARFTHDATDAFIEVNPRHAPFYRRLLGFRQIGDQRLCPRVSAPAVFLHIELSYMAAQIERHGGSFDARQHSLYPYFTQRGDTDRLPRTRERRQAQYA